MRKKITRKNKLKRLKFLKNYPLISREEQKKLKSLLIISPGLGLNSVILRDLCRLGIQKFLIADKDKVTLENLNRQHYTINQIGKLKTKATKENLKKINPSAIVKVFNDFIKINNIENFLEMTQEFKFSDIIVIDGIDPFQHISVSKILAKEVLQRGWIYFYPADLGWGSGLVVFTKRNKEKIEKFFGKLPNLKNMANYVKIHVGFPSYVLKLFQLHSYPQPITSVLCASVLTINAIMKFIKKKRLPHIQIFDPLESFYSTFY